MLHLFTHQSQVPLRLCNSFQDTKMMNAAKLFIFVILVITIALFIVLVYSPKLVEINVDYESPSQHVISRHGVYQKESTVFQLRTGLQSILTIIQNYNLSSYLFEGDTLSSIKTLKKEIHLDKNHPVRVVIHAKYRTGSTFTSEFLMRHKNVSFIFEPLNTKAGAPNSSADQIAIIRDMLRCQYESEAVSSINDAWLSRCVFCFVAQQTPGCIGEKKPLKLDHAHQHCLNTQHTAIKIIRLSHISPLVGLMEEGVKILHLVRDPRAMAHSRSHLRKASILEEAQSYCDEAMRDIMFMDLVKELNPYYQDYYKLITYEYMANYPKKGMTNLYDFINIEPDEAVRDWVEDLEDVINQESMMNTKRKPSRTHSYNTERHNSAVTSEAWRKDIDFDTVRLIQKVCVEFMQTIGYTINQSETELRNLSQPIYR